ncbi:hypothetical protein CK203_011878 [Vitis vinifera]|uniref:Uncharacterized protein n=1 Tax=Vitis vinifera TaxID=29760 RepID=A0A438K089_VITVI|nr:hypothetical protein CK203_011878 [Vitis vinifera]
MKSSMPPSEVYVSSDDGFSKDEEYENQDVEERGYIGHNSKRSETNEGWKHLEVSLVDFDTLLNATNNVFSDNKLGDAGFRPIYKVKPVIFKFQRQGDLNDSKPSDFRLAIKEAFLVENGFVEKLMEDIIVVVGKPNYFESTRGIQEATGSNQDDKCDS